MIGSGRFLSTFSGHTGSQADPELFQGIVRGAARAGFHLMFIRPDSKEPVCPLPSRAVKLADTAAQEAAEAAGVRRWDRVRHDCGRAHATNDPKFLDTYLKRIAKAGQPMPNLAIDVGRSNMVCIDVDTPAEYAGWKASWAANTGTDWDTVGELTVTSPGVYDPATDTWKHHGGGHVWIDLSTVEPSEHRDILLQVGEGVYKDPSGWTAMYRDRYVLVPPSVREGRAYEFTGAPIDGNADWLLTLMANAAAQREVRRMEAAERRATRLADPATGLGEAGMITWSTATPWSALLAPLGWVDTGLVHSCGCPDWTMAPVDDHASARSATAHEDGCSASGFDNDEGHHALMIWSDNRPSYLVNVPRDGTKIMTKVQFAAAVARPESRHGEPLNREDIAAGLRAHGLSADGVKLVGLNAPLTPDSLPPAPVTAAQITAAVALPLMPPLQEPDQQEPPIARSLATALQEPPLLGRLGSAPTGAPTMHPHTIEPTPVTRDPAAHLVTTLRNPYSVLALPPPTPVIEGTLDLGNLFRLFGASGSGKTHVAVDMAVAVAAGLPWAGKPSVGRGRVLYVAPEDPEGVQRRIVASLRDKGFSDTEGAAVCANLMVVTRSDLQAHSQGWAELVEIVREYRPALVFIDTQAQVTSQEYDENSNREMTQFVTTQVAWLRDVCGAAVGLVAHTPKTGDVARGASAVTASMDVEYLIKSDKQPGAPTITITNTKAKNRAEWDVSLDAFLVTVGGSVALSFDPVRRPVPPTPPPPSAEESLMTSARQQALLAELRGPMAGMTRSQALKHLGTHGGGGFRVSERSWSYDFDALFTAGLLIDTHGTRYVKTPGDVPDPGPGVESVKVYDKSMPLHVTPLSCLEEPPETQTEPEAQPPGPGPEV